jgi:hypothetical protein
MAKILSLTFNYDVDEMENAYLCTADLVDEIVEMHRDLLVGTVDARLEIRG